MIHTRKERTLPSPICQAQKLATLTHLIYRHAVHTTHVPRQHVSIVIECLDMQITPSVRNNQDIAYGRDFQLHLQVGTFRSDKHRSHIQIHAVVILICTRHTCCKLRHTDDILDTDTIQLHTTVGASTVKKAANMRHIDSIITSLYITLANGS
jgi:hypothetical protein